MRLHTCDHFPECDTTEFPKIELRIELLVYENQKEVDKAAESRRKFDDIRRLREEEVRKKEEERREKSEENLQEGSKEEGEGEEGEDNGHDVWYELAQDPRSENKWHDVKEDYDSAEHWSPKWTSSPESSAADRFQLHWDGDVKSADQSQLTPSDNSPVSSASGSFHDDDDDDSNSDSSDVDLNILGSTICPEPENIALPESPSPSLPSSLLSVSVDPTPTTSSAVADAGSEPRTISILFDYDTISPELEDWEASPDSDFGLVWPGSVDTSSSSLIAASESGSNDADDGWDLDSVCPSTQASASTTLVGLGILEVLRLIC